MLDEIIMLNNATRLYEFYKNKWSNTKPIRGRSVDVRPIGKRRRDWEQVTRKDIGNGQYSYCAKLWDTECVEYLPDGSIKLRIGGWATPSTAEFIHEHSPFTCFKQNRKLWVQVRENAGEVKAYPLGQGDLHLLAVDDGRWYRSAEPVVIKKQVVNRAKAKEARADVQPFLTWTKTFLKMSDGWVMHETRKQVFGWEGNNFKITGRTKDSQLLERITSGDDEEYLRVLCELARHLPDMEQRMAESFTRENVWNGQKYPYTDAFHDYRMNFEVIKRNVYKLVDKGADIHDTIEVEPTNKTMTNVI